jgi:hypothetical protein
MNRLTSAPGLQNAVALREWLEQRDRNREAELSQLKRARQAE